MRNEASEAVYEKEASATEMKTILDARSSLEARIEMGEITLEALEAKLRESEEALSVLKIQEAACLTTVIL